MHVKRVCVCPRYLESEGYYPVAVPPPLLPEGPWARREKELWLNLSELPLLWLKLWYCWSLTKKKARRRSLNGRHEEEIDQTGPLSFFFALLINKTAPIKRRVHRTTFTPDDPSPNTHSNYWLKYINPPYDLTKVLPAEGNARGKRKEICGQRETD